MSQILTLIIFYFLILFSILGYGRIVTIFNSNYQASSFDGLIGISILILISFITNIFFPHNFIHNSIIILFGLFLFIYDLKNNYSNRLKELKLLLLIFSIIFIGILLYKNHDDFFYYHFPYSLILTNFEKIFGLGNLVLTSSDKNNKYVSLLAIKDVEKIKDLIRGHVEKSRKRTGTKEVDFE